MRKLVIFSSAESAFEQRVFHKMAKTATMAFAEVVVIAQAEMDAVVGGVRIVALRPPRNRLLRILGHSIRAFCLARRENATIYQTSDPELLPWAFLLQKLTRRPVVYDLREYHAERIREKEWLPWLLREPVARLYEAAEKHLVKRLAGAVAVNEDLAKRLRAHGCQRVAVVPNYAPRELFEALPRDPCLEEAYAGRQVLVYPGVLARSRGITEAVEATAHIRREFPDVKLLLIGKFDLESYREEIGALVQRLDLRDHVEMIGPVPYASVPAYLAVANVGLCLLQPEHERYRETEPIKYFEFAAAGIPQVVSDLPALRRLVERNRNGLLADSTDPVAIAEATAQLLRHPDEARAMGGRGRRAFEAEYHWEAAAEKLLRLYWEVSREDH
jgi:glycosyltransferase involved in cell wall biosynthesis